MIITHNGTILKHDGTILTKITEVPPQPPFSNTYSLDFDGVDDYVLIENGNFDATNGLTLSFWVKYDGVGAGNNWLFSNGGSGGVNSQFNTRFTADGRWFNYLAGGSFYTGINGLNDGNWHHLTQVIDYQNSIMYFYKDGSKSTTTRSSGYSEVDWSTISTPFFPFKGQVDEVALIGRVLTQSEIDVISSTPTDLTSLAPVVWLRNGDNGSYKSPQFLIPNNENKDKVSNYSFDFDGVDDYVDCGNSAALKPNIITVSCWIKGSTQTAFTRIISQDGPTGGADAYGFYVTTALNKVVFAIKTNVTGTVTSATSGVVLDNNWHHLVGTYDGSEVILYVDGVAVGSPSAGTSILSYGSGTLTIGCFSEPTSLPSYLFNGNIDDVSIFNSVIPIGDLWDGSGQPTTLPSGAVAHYKMGEEANFTSNWLVDNSALTNYSKRSFDFDGVDDYISVSDNSIGQTQNISYSIWVNLDVTTRQYIIGNQSSSNGGCGLSIETGDVLIFQMADGTNDSFFNSRVASFSTYAPINTWNHILATWDGTDSKIYINGVLRNTWSPTLPYTISGYDTTFNIGWRNAGLIFMMNGKLDELALFNTAISIGDVWDGSGQPIDVSAVSGLTNNWRMGEDASFNGTNWTVPDNLGTSTGTSANMTVDSLVGEAANYSGGGISNAMTIQDRVGDAPNSENNALSYNMDEVDRVEDTPTP